MLKGVAGGSFSLREAQFGAFGKIVVRLGVEEVVMAAAGVMVGLRLLAGYSLTRGRTCSKLDLGPGARHRRLVIHLNDARGGPRACHDQARGA